MAKFRLNLGEWGLKHSTRNRKLIKFGDLALIYTSGPREYGSHFIAHAIIGSKAIPISNIHSQAIDAPGNSGIVLCEYAIKISGFTMLKTPVDIRTIKEKLRFIKNPHSSKWGGVLTSGTLRVARQDYELILRLGSTE